MPPGLAKVKSGTKGMLAGNISFGGIIGAAVDAGTGAAYDYPSLITIMMGEDIRLPAVTPPVVLAATPAPELAPAAEVKGAPAPAK